MAPPTDSDEEAGEQEIAGPAPAGAESLLRIRLADLEPDPFQPRKAFRETSIRQLADSLEQHGLLQPLLVRPRQGPNSAGRYWIVAGERRYRAASHLGWESISCRVQPYQALTAAVTALVDNVHREDLSDIEKAEALIRLRQMTGKSWDEVARLVRLTSEYVRTLQGLVKLEEPVKEKVRRGELSARTALALKPLRPEQQVEMAERAVREGLTAERIRAETRPATERSTRTAPAPSSVNVTAARPVSSPAPEAEPPSDDPVIGELRGILQRLEEMSVWLDGQSWSPKKVTPEQRRLVEMLYHAASAFQQQTAGIRRPLKEAEPSDAEKLRSAQSPF